MVPAPNFAMLCSCSVGVWVAESRDSVNMVAWRLTWGTWEIEYTDLGCNYTTESYPGLWGINNVYLWLRCSTYAHICRGFLCAIE